MSTRLVDLGALTPAQFAAYEAARRDFLKDKGYQLLPLGEDVREYLRVKRKELTDSSYRSYEGTLDKLARDFPDLRVEDFEPPAGTQRLERFLDDRWGGSAPGTYNVCHAHVKDFFTYWRLMGRLHGDPMLLVKRAKKRDILRTVFSDEQQQAILAAAVEQRDRLALRLLLSFGLRKGALRAVQFKHFDWQRRELMVFTKGQKIRSLPLPDATFWTELERLTLETEAQPTHFLMCLVKPIPRAGVRRFPARQMSSTAMHRWWYRQLEHAGIVATGETSGERMHKARHTAGQRVLDATGDLKLTQRLLGHASIQTTGDTYTDYDNAALAAKLADVFRREAEEE